MKIQQGNTLMAAPTYAKALSGVRSQPVQGTVSGVRAVSSTSRLPSR